MITVRFLPVKMLAALVICLSIFILVTPLCAADIIQDVPSPDAAAADSNEQTVPAQSTDNLTSETSSGDVQDSEQSTNMEPATGNADTTAAVYTEHGVSSESASTQENESLSGVGIDQTTSNPTGAEIVIEGSAAETVVQEQIITDVSGLPDNSEAYSPLAAGVKCGPALKSMTVQGLVGAGETDGVIRHTLSPGRSVADSLDIAIPMAVVKTDILFVFDTSGSSKFTNQVLKQDCINLMNHLNQMGDVDYGVATFMDYTNTYTSYGYSALYGDASKGDYPYRLDQQITNDDNQVLNALNLLPVGSGSDNPEAYTRALYESYGNPDVNWRSDARRIVILVGDSMPHDNNLNEGFSSTVWSLGGDPGRDQTMFTADDLDWQTVLQEMAGSNITLIHCRTFFGYQPLWNYWAGITGGEAIDASMGSVAPQLLSAVTSRIGKGQLADLHLVPSDYQSWVVSDPASYPTASVGYNYPFNVTFTVPMGTLPGVYSFNLSAVDSSGASYNDIPVEITVPLAEMPTASISYDTVAPTNGSVMATLVNANKPITVTNNSGSNTYIFNDNGTFTFEFIDELGYTGTATATVNWIDKTPPTGSISYSPDVPSRGPVKAVLGSLSEAVSITNNGGSDTYSFSNNGSFTFEFVDAVGNIGTATATVSWIDSSRPTAEISYNVHTPTKGDVTATLVNASEPITVINNGGSTEYTFTQNGFFTFEFQDAVGNTGNAIAYVHWIDKTVPTATIYYTPSTATNKPVAAQLVPSEPVTIINNNGSDIYTFDDNGSFTFDLKDSVGNTGNATAVVTWIDKVSPVAEISFDVNVPTNGNVTATLVNASKPITVTNNGASMSYTFLENGSFTFEFIDQLGNAGTATAEVHWIDRIPPTAEVGYDQTNPTNGPVNAILVGTSEPIIVTNNSGASIHTFTDNGTFTFEFRDTAGNVGSAAAEVTWIDKELPTAQISYNITTPTNGPVVARLTNPSEPITIINNGGSDQYTFSSNGSFAFEFKDAVGNTGTVTAVVSWIDTTAPTAHISYDPTTPTNGPVTAVLSNPSEVITITNNGGSNQYVFTQNGSFTFEFKDAAGNIGTAAAAVSWINSSSKNGTVIISCPLFSGSTKVACVCLGAAKSTSTPANGIGLYHYQSNSTSGNLKIWGPKAPQFVIGELNSFFMSDFQTGDRRVLLEYAVGGVQDSTHTCDSATKMKIAIVFSSDPNKKADFEMTVYNVNGNVLFQQTGILAQGYVWTSQ